MDSLISLDNSCILRETFNSNYDVQKNGGTISTTGVTIDNGKATILGNNIIILRKVPKRTASYRIIFKIDNWVETAANQEIFSVNGTILDEGLWIQLNTLSLYKTSTLNNLYINGMYCIYTYNPIKVNVWYDIVITVSNNTKNLNIPIIGSLTYASTKRIIQYRLFEDYNRVLTAQEIKLLYQQRAYIKPFELPLLLDFDSTRGVLEDKIGKNKLTPTSTVLLKNIGKVYSAYFNGVDARINCGSLLLTGSYTFNLWLKIIKIANNSIYGNNNTYLNNGAKFFLTSNHATIDNTTYSNKTNVWVNLCITRDSTGKGSYYINGKFDSILISGVPTTDQTTIFYIGFAANGYANCYIPKLQIFNGIPSNTSEFATQLYTTQKGMFI